MPAKSREVPHAFGDMLACALAMAREDLVSVTKRTVAATRFLLAHALQAKMFANAKDGAKRPAERLADRGPPVIKILEGMRGLNQSSSRSGLASESDGETTCLALRTTDSKTPFFASHSTVDKLFCQVGFFSFPKVGFLSFLKVGFFPFPKVGYSGMKRRFKHLVSKPSRECFQIQFAWTKPILS